MKNTKSNNSNTIERQKKDNQEETITIFIDTETISLAELEEGDLYNPEDFEV